MRSINTWYSWVALFLSIGWSTATVGQYTGLDISREFKKAYLNETRSLDGRPGQYYWQNRAEYRIKARVFPNTSSLEGEAEITYFNNSPDTLSRIVFRVYQDLLKKGVQKDYTAPPEDIHEGVVFKYFSVNGEKINPEDPGVIRRRGTILYLQLPKALLPGEKIAFSMGWSFHIPEKFHLRMGKGDEGSWYIAYWYPQIAVYDDISGWDTFPYEGMSEFYLDLASFEVEIEAPNDFGVWAGAQHLNPEEVYQPSFVKKIKTAYASDEVHRLITAEDIHSNKQPFLTNSPTLKWKFKAEQSPDFAFTFGNHYLWDATGITLRDGRRININAVYREIAEDFHEMAEMTRLAVDHFSHELPGVPYPYPSMTVVHGVNDNTSGGMEFPMICNNPASPNRGRSVDIMSHEVAHIYFPFYVLTNEKRYAWMDEGWAAMLPAQYMKTVAPSTDRLAKYTQQLGQYIFGNLSDLPIAVPTYTLSSFTYFGGSYSKPALAYYYLQQELGKELFQKTLQAYIHRWKFKHPTPYDFFFTFNDASGKDLDWFWNAWFFKSGIPDLAIGKIEATWEGHIVEILNKGSLPVPVELELTYTDGKKEKANKTIGIWADGKKSIRIKTGKNVKSIRLGGPYIPDMNPDDNFLAIQ